MTGDIPSTAGLTVHEPDDGVAHCARWRPFDQNALSRSPILAPARDRPGPGMERSEKAPAHKIVARGVIAEAAD
jgi:hypothetical protein